MSWLTLILISVIFSSLVSIFDKFYCSKKIKSVYSFAFLVNFFYLFYVATTVIILKKSFVLDWSIVFSALSGLTYFFMWIFWWKAMVSGEASRVVAIASVGPVISAFLAVIFLNEVLSINKWLAILLVVAGAILCTWEKKKKRGFNQAYLYAFVATCFGAVGNIIVKFSTTNTHALVVNSISFFATFPLFLLMLKNKEVYIEVKNNLKNIRSFILLLFRSLIGYSAICFYMLAVGAGPISLVVAVNSSAPLLVFIYSTLFSIFLPKIVKEELSKETLFTKSIAIVMIVVGVVVISI